MKDGQGNEITPEQKPATAPAAAASVIPESTPAKLDDAQICELPAEDLKKRISDSLARRVSIDSDSPPVAKPKEVVVAPSPAAAPAPGASPKPGEDGYLYAGKYKSVDELIKGLENIGKPLNYPPNLIEGFIAHAKANNDWSKLEEVYKTLDTAVSAKKGSEPAKPNDPPAPAPAVAQPSPKDTELAETERKAQEEKLGTVRAEEVARKVVTHPIMKQFRQLNVSLPKTTAELDALLTDHEGLYFQYLNAVKECQTEVDNEFKMISERLNGLDAAEKSAREKGETYIAAFNKRFNVGLTEDQIKKFVDDALSSEVAMEDFYGVKIPKQDGVEHFFKQNILPELLDNVKLSAEITGRTQGLEDLTKMHESVMSSISTAGLPASPKRAEVAPIDASDPSQRAKMTDAQLKERIAQSLKDRKRIE